MSAKTDLQDKIQKFKSSIASKATPPEYKTIFEGKLKDAEEQLAELEKQEKEAVAEKKEEEKKIEAAEKKVKEPSQKKGAKKAALKKKAKVNAKFEKKVKVIEKKYKTILTDLEKTIKKDKDLKKVYGAKTTWGLKKEKLDLERDAGRHSKPVGYRFKGKHNYRKPTKAEITKGLKTGRVYREIRPNRADVKARLHKHPLLKKGGNIHQAAPENKDSYTTKADKKEKARPVGYRFSEAAVEKGVVSNRGKYRTPKKSEVVKYSGKKYRGSEIIYNETRKDKSDKSPMKKI